MEMYWKLNEIEGVKIPERLQNQIEKAFAYADGHSFWSNPKKYLKFNGLWEGDDGVVSNCYHWGFAIGGKENGVNVLVNEVINYNNKYSSNNYGAGGLTLDLVDSFNRVSRNPCFAPNEAWTRDGGEGYW
jgi:hypothetical protein